MQNGHQARRIAATLSGAVGLVISMHASQSLGQISAQTRPLSPSVLGTIAFRNQTTIELVVLWRGSPGWFLSGTSRRANYGGNQTTFTASLDYGTVQLSLQYEPSAHTVRVQDTSVVLPSGANVVLVEDVDRKGTLRIAGFATLTPELTGNPTMAQMLGRSPEIVSFLRCGVGTPNSDVNQKIGELLCNDLK